MQNMSKSNHEDSSIRALNVPIQTMVFAPLSNLKPEKVENFDDKKFKRWQQKIHQNPKLIGTLSLQPMHGHKVTSFAETIFKLDWMILFIMSTVLFQRQRLSLIHI